MRKTISLVMATYNGARFIREQLDSIYNQTLLPDEVIVCDDCSTDGTVDILKEYSQTRGLHYYGNEKSLGVNGNFYKAMSLATCDYIAICDQDDIWLPEKIEITYRKLCEIDDGKPCVVSSLCNHIDADGNITINLPDNPDTYGFAATYMSPDASQGCSLMLNRELLSFVLEKKNEIIIYDAFISLTAAAIGQKYNLGKRLMLYRHHENNVISKAVNHSVSFKEKIKAQNVFKGFIPDSRLYLMPMILDVLRGEDLKPNVRSFLERASEISKTNKYIDKMAFVLKTKELPLSRRLRIIFFSSFIMFLKFLFG